MKSRMAVKDKRPPKAKEVITPARARPDKVDRVAHIEGLMRRFEWVRGKTGKELAAEWGMHFDQVKVDAAEASRRVEVDADEIRREVTTRGIEMLQRAQENDDTKGFAALGKLLADVSGANAPKKVEITKPPREEMWARLRSWLLAPTPELETVLKETGWTRTLNTSGSKLLSS